MIISQRDRYLPQESVARHLLSGMVSSDDLSVSDLWELEMGGVPLSELVSAHGAPLFVISDMTLRQNYHRFKSAFMEFWPGNVEVLYALKANPNPTICKILMQEGAGFDCTGFGEIELAFKVCASPPKTSLNGSNKSEEEVTRAVSAGALVILDSESDVVLVRQVACRLQKEARVALRLKAFDAEKLSGFQSDAYSSADDAATVLASKKWGVGFEGATKIIQEVKSGKWIKFLGYHVHVGRLTREADIVAANVAAFVNLINRLHKETGVVPSIVNIGGGWPGARDPEARTSDLNPYSIENYAELVCAALRDGFDRNGIACPSLWLEPGRYLVNNAGVLLTRVGCVKQDSGHCWVNVDASGEWLVLTTLHGARNIIAPISGMDRKFKNRVDIVGPNCIPAVFGKSLPFPDVSRGEILAILDAGAYSESQASQFNFIPRPASVLVQEGASHLITRRETYDDIFVRYENPSI